MEVSNRGNKTENVSVDWIYGGIRRCGRTFTAAYFIQNDGDGDGDKVALEGSKAILSDSGIADKVGVTTIPESYPLLYNGKALFRRDFVLHRSEIQSYCLIASYSKNSDSLVSRLEAADPEKLMKENQDYYRKILSEAVISTPNKIIDAGMRTALVNLDNIFTDSAWLEGVHWWNAYFTNLFQISASISLDQKVRAKNALIFYNNSKTGPAPAMKTDISPEDGTQDDGLDYYIYALMQYVNLTGDTSFLAKLWPDVMHAIKRIMVQKDPDGDKLLHWNFGCNIFLYQADMLGMPGKSASPSIITAGMMEKLSTLAKMIGKNEDAFWLERTSLEIKSAVMKDLWNSQEGCFYNHIDLQKIPHLSHYYSDHIFSTLYSSIDTIINWQSLYYLEKTLVANNPKGQSSLMRVGTLKGRLFGNDNVMPTQMSETARAFYRIGNNEQATSFLESVARAGTIFTEAPGNFPERMDDLGKGEANYLFGNPIGSFIYSVINGLFGVEIADLGQTLNWQPGFPANWDHADLKLSYAKVAYKLKYDGNTSHAYYKAEYPSIRALHFSLFLLPCNVLKVLCNGKEINYKIHPGLNRIELDLKAEPSLSHELEIIYLKKNPNECKEITIAEGTVRELQFDQDVAGIIDPQSLLKGAEIKGKGLKLEVGRKTGRYELFAKLKDPEYYFPVKLNIIPEFEISLDTARFDATRNTLSINSDILINNDSDKVYDIILSFPYLNRTQTVRYENSNSVHIVFDNFPIPSNSVAYVNFQLHDENGKIFESINKIIYRGTDNKSDHVIQLKREGNIHQVDISKLYNSDSYMNMFPWGRNDVPFSIPLATKDGYLLTKYGIFAYSHSEKTLALIELGRSDVSTRKTIPTRYTTKVEIPVGAKASEIDLLYFSEVESRNTGCRVGSIVLSYEVNDTVVLPLIVGRNMDFVRSYLAKDAFPVFVNESIDEIVSYSPDKKYDKCCGKHLMVLPVLCDQDKQLSSVEIKIEAADAQFGLLGVNWLN